MLGRLVRALAVAAVALTGGAAAAQTVPPRVVTTCNSLSTCQSAASTAAERFNAANAHQKTIQFSDPAYKPALFAFREAKADWYHYVQAANYYNPQITTPGKSFPNFSDKNHPNVQRATTETENFVSTWSGGSANKTTSQVWFQSMEGQYTPMSVQPSSNGGVEPAPVNQPPTGGGGNTGGGGTGGGNTGGGTGGDTGGGSGPGGGIGNVDCTQPVNATHPDCQGSGGGEEPGGEDPDEEPTPISDGVLSPITGKFKAGEIVPAILAVGAGLLSLAVILLAVNQVLKMWTGYGLFQKPSDKAKVAPATSGTKAGGEVTGRRYRVRRKK